MTRTVRLQLGLSIAFLALYVALFALLPQDGPLFFDWQTFFARPDTVPAYYPPWTRLVVPLLSLPVVAGLTVTAFAWAAWRRARSPLSAGLACLAMPLYGVLALGQIDGLALLGTLILPWGVPLVLMKPHLAAFAVLARRKWALVAAAFVALSFVVWGLWPAASWQSGITSTLDISPGWWGLPVFALLVWRMPKDDPDWWMLAGATITPFLTCYHLLVLMPALARLRWPWALALALASWLPLTSYWLGDWAWYLGWVPLAGLAAGLALEKQKAKVLEPPTPTAAQTVTPHAPNE